MFRLSQSNLTGSTASGNSAGYVGGLVQNRGGTANSTISGNGGLISSQGNNISPGDSCPFTKDTFF